MSKFKQLMIVLILLSVLVAFYARGAEEVLIDPTAPLFVLPAEGEGLGIDFMNQFPALFEGFELSSILIRENDRVAVINEQRVRVGDTIGIARVTAIEPRHVTLNVDGEIQTLELYESTVKTLVKGKG